MASIGDSDTDDTNDASKKPHNKSLYYNMRNSKRSNDADGCNKIQHTNSNNNNNVKTSVAGADTDTCDSVDLPSSNDVLLGRGRPIITHPGNQRMLAIVDRYKKMYSSLPREERRPVAEMVFDEVCNNGCRFLKRDEDECWVEVDRVKGVDKISHALRSSCRGGSGGRGKRRRREIESEEENEEESEGEEKGGGRKMGKSEDGTGCVSENRNANASVDWSVNVNEDGHTSTMFSSPSSSSISSSLPLSLASSLPQSSTSSLHPSISSSLQLPSIGVGGLGVLTAGLGSVGGISSLHGSSGIREGGPGSLSSASGLASTQGLYGSRSGLASTSIPVLNGGNGLRGSALGDSIVAGSALEGLGIYGMSEGSLLYGVDNEVDRRRNMIDEIVLSQLRRETPGIGGVRMDLGLYIPVLVTREEAMMLELYRSRVGIGNVGIGSTNAGNDGIGDASGDDGSTHGDSMSSS